MKKSIKIGLICLYVVGMTTCTFSDAASQSFRLTNLNDQGRNVEQYVDMRLPLTVEFDQGDNIKFRSFIAPKNAIYHFDAQLNFSYPLVNDTTTDETRFKFKRWYLNLYNGYKIIESSVLTNNENATATPNHSLAISTTVKLNKGDAISIGFKFDADPEQYVTLDFISFSGFKVADLLIKMAPIPSPK